MKYLVWIFLVLIIAVRYFTSLPHFVNGQILQISGQLYSEPNPSGHNIIFNLSGIKVLMPVADIHYGDEVIVEGTFANNLLIKTKLVRQIPSNNIFVNLRKSLITFWQASLPSPLAASLASGITIGAKSDLPRNFKNKLTSTGTSHIVVASGMNVTMTASFVLSIFLLLMKRKKAVVLTIITIWFYTFISGFEAPIIRAAIMATIAFSAQAAGRVADTIRYTFITGFVMLLVNPLWITDVGFLLSFATTISLILFQGSINKFFKFLPEIIREDLSTSVAAQVGSAPIILFFFGRINLLSPLINVLVLWIVPIVMIVSAIGAAVGIFIPALGRLIMLTIYPLLAWFIAVVNFFS